MTNRHTAPIRGNPKPYFQAGQRVVCVNAAPNRLALDRKLLVAGRIYIVRAIDVSPGWKWPWWGVHLEGIRHLYLNSVREWPFHPGRFRPVTERPTDITVFRELAAAAAASVPSPVKVSPTHGARP
jgi:hypothetical protein